jgi:SAM-dependent methyltransferase
MELNKWKRKFDVVIAFELLEHLDQQEQQELVRLIRRILKPGGMVVMSTPNRLVFSGGRKRSRYPFHKHELTVNELKQLFSKYFRRVKITGIKCVNQQHLQQRQRLESSLGHRLIDWLTGFGWIHRLLPLIPKSLKTWVTGEGILPELGADDYQLIDERVEKCEDFWLEARV